MRKHKMEKDLLKDFFFHLRENDFTIIKKIVPKSYERTNYKGDVERTIVNFSCVIEKVSTKDIEREINLFILENYDV